MDISSISNASGNTEPPPSADEQTQNDESEMSDSDITESDLDNPLNVTPHQLDNDVNNSMETAEAIIIKNPDPDPDIESNNQKRKLSTKHENNKKIKTSDGSDGDNYEEEEEENGNNIFGPLARRDSFEQESRDPEMYVSGMESDTETLDEDEPKLDDKEETDEINLTDIIQQGISLDKPVELSDILEHTEDIEKVVAGDIDLNTGEDENEDNDDDEIMNEAEKETETKLLKDPEDEMDFDISEKLREMGEISVQPVSKSDAKKSSDIENKDEVSLEITKKGGSSSSNSNDDSEDKRKVTNLRKNIREVMDDNQLDASTLAAQREELERLARVQEQQKIIRAVQRQIELEKQNNKTQSRVISLLQGHTSLLKTSASNASSSKVTLPGSSGTVLVKIPASEAKNRGLKFGDAMKQNMANLTPSVSIAPVRAPIKKEKTDEEEREAKINAQIEAEEAAAEEEAAKAKKDIVTIVDSSSDDDCIVLSDDGEEDEPDDDPQNSGLHVNDAYNIPDDQGRVVINIGHPEGEPDIFVAPQIARIIKPHQIGGVRFLYDNIIESVDRFDTSTGFGCILAHSMGLGKTLQLVCFCDILLRHTSSKSVLCIMPINTLQNWLAEFNMWLPEDAEKTPMRAHGEVRTRNFKLHVLNDAHKSLSARSKVVLDWARDGGVLLIGYEMYRLLSLKKMTKKKKSKKAEMDPEIDREEIEGHMKLLEDMYEALVKPGPDLVVCDEGHRIKNSHASISLALKQIRSKRRIVLTGYPLQNNLLEYWCMVDFVRPNYLGTKTEFSNMFERPIQNGQCIDSTPQDIKLMRYRAHVLHSLLLGFVQRRSHVVLQTSLPQKEEYVMLVRMTEFQRKLYDIFMNDVVRTKAVPNPLKAFAVCCKIWNHPDVLYNFLRKREADLDLELEEAEAAANGTTVAAIQSKNSKKGATPRKSRSKKATNTTKTVDKDGKTKPAATISPTTGSSNSNSEATMSSSSTTSTQQSFATTNNQSESSSQSTTMGISQMNISQPTTMENTLNPQSGYNNSTFIKQESNSNNSNLMNQDVKPPQMASQATHNTNDGSSYTNYNQYSNTGYDSYNSYNSGNNYYGDYNSSYANQNSSQQNQQPATNNYYQNQYQTNYGYNQNQSGYPQNNMSNYWQNNPDYYQNNLGYNQNYPDYNTHHNQNLYGNNGNYPTDQQHQSQQQQQQQQQQNYDNRYPSYDNRQNTQEWQSNSNIPTANTATSAPAATTMTTTSDIVGTPKSVTAEEDKSSAIVDMDTKEIKVESKPPITPPPEQNDASASASASAAASPSEVIKTEIKEEVKEEEIIKAKDDGIPYDWAIELMKGYVADLIQNSPKMEIFFCILEESLKLGDRMLVFSQSLLTLNLIEKFLQSSIVTGTEVKWAKNINYYRLDGSTSALDREKLINEFNSNPNIQLFLVSTRAGSLGINLVGANRVVVFDASWNPCHDTQAVCRVYRYGQKKPCFVYRLVMDNCLEKKIYDRQVNKQGMSDRVVDECNPDAHLSLREVTNLCWDDEKDSDIKDFSEIKDKFIDIVMQKVLESHSKSLSKEPFQHESLLIDRKEKKLSQAEKRLAQRGYELEKQAAARPSYVYNSVGTQYRTIRTPDGSIVHRPVASVRPMQAEMNDKMVGARPGGARPTRWIPAEVWQRQGMTAQEMTLPLDVVIPTSSAEKANIVLKAGQKVMVLKSPKGIYMQLESGKIIAIRTAFKMGQKQEVNKSTSNIITNTNANANSNSNTNINNRDLLKKVQTSIATSSNIPSGLKNNSSITVIPTKQQVGNKMITSVVKPGNNFGGASPSSQIRPMTIVNKTKIPMQSIIKNKNTGAINKNIQLATTKPYNLKQGAKFDVGMMKPTNFGPKKDAIESGNSSNSFDGKSAGSSEEINDLSKDDDTEIIEERSNKSFDVAMTNEPIVQDDENARDSDNMQLVSNNVKQEISTPIISNEATTEVPSESKKLDKEINNSNDSNQQPNKNEDVIMVSSEIKEPPKVLAPPQQQSDIYNVQPPYGMNYGTMPPYYYYPYQQQYPYYNQQQQQYYPGYPPPQPQQLHTQPSHLASYNPQTHSADLNYGGISAPISTPISTINQSTTVTAASQTMPNYPPSPIMSRSITQPKSSTAVSAPATTPTITIDDDIDPPLREKLVYKPNLVERKSRKNQQALPPPEPQHSMQYGSPGSQDTGMQSQSMARTSLKNYRHKAVTNKIQTAPTHNPMSHSHQIPPQYGIHQKEPERIYSPAQNQYPAPMMQNTQQNMSHDHYQFNQPKYENSSIRFLERTTSAIDDKQSGFNTSLTNITNSPSPSPIQQSSKEIMQPQFKPTKPVKTPKPRNRKKPEKNSPVIQPPPISQTQSQQSHGPLHQPQQQLQSHLQQQQQQQQQSQPQQQPQPQPQPQPQQQQLHSPLHQPVQPSTHMQQYPQSHIQQQSQSHMQQQPQSNLQHQPQSHLQQQTQSHLKHQQQSQSHQQQQSQMHPQHQLHSHQPISSNPPQPLKTPEPIMTNEKSTSKTSSKSKVPSIKNIPAPFSSSMAGLASSGGTASNSLLPTSTQNEIQSGGVSHKSLPGQYNPSHPPYYTTPPDPLSNYSQPTSAAVPISAAPPSQAQHHQASTVTATSQQQQQHQQSLYPPYSGSYGHLYTAPAAVVSHNSTTSMSSPAPTIASTTSSPTAIGLQTYTTPSYSLPPNPYETTTYTPPLSGSAFHRPDMSPPTIYSANPYSTIPASSTSQPSQDHTQTPTSSSSSLAPSIFTPSANIYQPPVIPPLPPPSIVTASYQSAYPSQFPQIPPPSSVSQSTYPTPPPSGYGYHLPPSPYATAHYPGAPSVPYTLPPAGQYDPSRYPPPPPLPTTVDPQYPTYGAYGYSPYPPHSSAGQWQ